MLNFAIKFTSLTVFTSPLQAGLGIEPSRNASRSAVGFAARGAHQHLPRQKPAVNFWSEMSEGQIVFGNK